MPKKGKKGGKPWYKSGGEEKDERPTGSTEGPLQRSTGEYSAVRLGTHTCESADCPTCRVYPHPLPDSDDPYHTPHGGQGALSRPGQCLRVGCDEVRSLQLSVTLTVADLEHGCVATVSFADDYHLQEIRERSEFDGYHILPTEIRAQSTGDSPVPISVQLLTSVPDPGEIGVARTSIDKHWLASNISSNHQLGQVDEHGNKTGHGYLIRAGSHQPQWRKCYSCRPTVEMRRAALTHYGQAAGRLHPNATLPLAKGPGGSFLPDFATYLAYSTADKSAEGDDAHPSLTLSTANVKDARALMIEHHKADDKRNFLMNLDNLRVRFDTFDGHGTLLKVLSSPDPMLRGHVGVQFEINYIPVRQKPLPRPVDAVEAGEEDEEDEEEEEEEEEDE